MHNNNLWKSSGIPAIFKLIERLESHSISATVLFFDTNRVIHKKGNELQFNSFGDKFKFVRILSYTSQYYDNKISFLKYTVEWIKKIKTIISLYERYDCNIMYIDRSNLSFAAILSLFKYKVLWRCLGVAPYHLRKESRKIHMRLLYMIDSFFLMMPISLTICTLDGSPWKSILKRMWWRKRLIVIPNGVDKTSIDNNYISYIKNFYDLKSSFVITFIGRLENSKNIFELLHALNDLKENSINFRALICGYGSLSDQVIKFIDKNNLDNFVKIVGRVEHRNVGSYIYASDVVVSVAQAGSLTNVTLESLSIGSCVLTLESDKLSGINIDVDNFVPKKIMVRINRKNIRHSLYSNIKILIENKNLIKTYKEESRKFVIRSVKKWDDRLDFEIYAMDRVLNNCITKRFIKESNFYNI
jgi:glycosyltransferase involved in cell wall biosynthesis